MKMEWKQSIMTFFFYQNQETENETKIKKANNMKTCAPNDESGQLCQLFLRTIPDKNMIRFLLHCNIQCCTNKWILKIRAKDQKELKKKETLEECTPNDFQDFWLCRVDRSLSRSLSFLHVQESVFVSEVLSLIYVCQYYIRMCAFKKKKKFASGWLFDSKINEKKNTQFLGKHRTQKKKSFWDLKREREIEKKKRTQFEEHGHVWKEINQVLANSSSDPSNLTLHMSEFMICAAVFGNAYSKRIQVCHHQTTTTTTTK